MRLHRSRLVVSACILLSGVLAPAQGRKPGLYQVATTMTWQHSPFPAGTPGHRSGHVADVCVTQAQIDQYGDVGPQVRDNCHLADVEKSPAGMKARLVCTKPMEGSGTVESTYTDADHSHTVIHFTGTMQMGANTQPAEWTLESTAVYKGSDCGSVKPSTVR